MYQRLQCLGSRAREEIAEALAERLAKILPRAADDPEARLAPFADPNVAQRISQMIDQGLQNEGAREVTASHRDGSRLVVQDGCSYLLPTIVQCDNSDHPLANKEFMFPFASVVAAQPDDIPAALGPSLVVTAITSDPKLINKLVASPNVDRLNIGASSNKSDELGPAARGQSLRTPVRAPRFPARFGVRRPVAAFARGGLTPLIYAVLLSTGLRQVAAGESADRSAHSKCNEDSLSHGRRWADVLRQLSARQRTRNRADRARS